MPNITCEDIDCSALRRKLFDENVLDSGVSDQTKQKLLEILRVCCADKLIPAGDGKPGTFVMGALAGRKGMPVPYWFTGPVTILVLAAIAAYYALSEECHYWGTANGRCYYNCIKMGAVGSIAAKPGTPCPRTYRFLPPPP